MPTQKTTFNPQKAALTLKKLIDARKKERLNNLIKTLHPADAADAITWMAGAYWPRIACALTTKNLETIYPELSNSVRQIFLKAVPTYEMIRVIENISTEHHGTLFSDLEYGQNDVLKKALKKEYARYPIESSGNLMEKKSFGFLETKTVMQTIEIMKSKGIKKVYQWTKIMIVNAKGELTGTLPISQLILSNHEDHLKDIMDESYHKVGAHEDQEYIAHIFHRYNLYELPVVDDRNKLIGIIRVGQALNVSIEESREDALRMAGVGRENVYMAKTSTSIFSRLPWLWVNLVTAFIATSIINMYEEDIRAYAILAMFFPIVAMLGGNAANQSMTIIVQDVARTGNLPRPAHRIFHELIIGMANGLCVGIPGVLIGLWVTNDIYVSVTLGIAIALTMMISTMMGSLVPIMLKKINIDPALASSILLTTIADALGFFIFFALSRHII